MNRILCFLFPARTYSSADSWFLLAMRLLFGLLLMSHGVAKWSHFDSLSQTFPDILGLGSHAGLVLAIFAEVICAAGFIVGAFYRLALIPMIFTMCMAAFVAHAHQPFSTMELPFVYLAVYVMMFIAGPGSYALDRLVTLRMQNFKSDEAPKHQPRH